MNPDPATLSPEAENQLRESLRRCSPETVVAAVAYRRTRDPQHLPALIGGVFERYIEPEIRPKLASANRDDLRVIEDLGIDSLTLMEIVMLLEEAGGLTIANDELRQLRTLGDIRTFVDCRVRGLPYSPPARLDHEAVLAVMPVQPPFLFIDEAVISKTSISATYRITGEEVFLQGHFKGNPVMPGCWRRSGNWAFFIWSADSWMMPTIRLTQDHCSSLRRMACAATASAGPAIRCLSASNPSASRHPSSFSKATFA